MTNCGQVRNPLTFPCTINSEVVTVEIMSAWKLMWSGVCSELVMMMIMKHFVKPTTDCWYLLCPFWCAFSKFASIPSFLPNKMYLSTFNHFLKKQSRRYNVPYKDYNSYLTAISTCNISICFSFARHCHWVSGCFLGLKKFFFRGYHCGRYFVQRPTLPTTLSKPYTSGFSK